MLSAQTALWVSSCYLCGDGTSSSDVVGVLGDPVFRFQGTASCAELQAKYAHLESGEEVLLEGEIDSSVLYWSVVWGLEFGALCSGPESGASLWECICHHCSATRPLGIHATLCNPCCLTPYMDLTIS